MKQNESFQGFNRVIAPHVILIVKKLRRDRAVIPLESTSRASLSRPTDESVGLKDDLMVVILRVEIRLDQVKVRRSFGVRSINSVNHWVSLLSQMQILGICQSEILPLLSPHVA